MNLDGDPQVLLAGAERNEPADRRAASPPKDEAVATYAAAVDGVSLSVDVAGGAITASRHVGACSDATRQALDTLCAVLPGLPMQEAADHGALRALYRRSATQGSGRPDAVAGILGPRNAGPAYALAERLIRAVHGKFLAATGAGDVTNDYRDPVSSAWAALAPDEASRRVQLLIDGFAGRSGLATGDIALAGLERNVRLTIRFSDGVEPARKPPLLRDLERQLRAATCEPIELLMEEREDANRLRRLKTPD